MPTGRDIELLIGGSTLAVAGVVLVSAMPGPDPCLPVLCPAPPAGLAFPLGPGGMTGAQIMALVLFLVGGATLIARALTTRRWLIAIAAAAAILIACWMFDGASAIGPWHAADGSPVGLGQRPFVVDVSRGPSHCGQQDDALLTMAWPPGSEVRGQRLSRSQTREFAWNDQNDLTGMNAVGDAVLVDDLPGDAVDTGLRRGSWQLWTSPSVGDTGVFLKSGGYIQRWPRVSPPGCM